MLATASNTFEVVLTPQMLSIIPVLAVGLQLVKGIPALAKLKPWFPLIAVGVAIGVAIALKMGPETQDQIWSGLIMGLATAGGYDAARMKKPPTA